MRLNHLCSDLLLDSAETMQKEIIGDLCRKESPHWMNLCKSICGKK